MQKTAIHRARDLSPELRHAAEALLGRELEEDETLSVRASKGFILREAPVGDARREAFSRLLAHGDDIAGRVRGIPAAEIDEAIDESIAHLRRHRR